MAKINEPYKVLFESAIKEPQDMGTSGNTATGGDQVSCRSLQVMTVDLHATVCKRTVDLHTVENATTCSTPKGPLLLSAKSRIHLVVAAGLKSHCAA